MCSPYWLIIELLPEPIILLTLAGKIIQANQSFKKCFANHLTVEPVGLTLSELFNIESKSLKKWLRIWARSSAMTPGSITLFSPQGNPIKVELEAAAVYQEGEPPFIVLRFQKQDSIIHHFIELKKKVHELDQKLANQMNQNHQLITLAHQDALTEIANRRAFKTRIQTYWFEAKQQQFPLSIILLDIDYFKNYNDLYGHLEGDRCLKKVAQVISQQARQDNDLVARYGGEEFVVLLKAAADTSFWIAQRIITSIRDLAIPHQGSPKAWITLSGGVSSTVPTPDQSWEDLVEQADQALYQAKTQGRDRVVLGL